MAGPVTIGHDSIIGANITVTRDIKPHLCFMIHSQCQRGSGLSNMDIKVFIVNK